MAQIDPEWLSRLKEGKTVSPLPISAEQDRLTQLPIQVLQELPNQPFRAYQETEPRWEQLRTSIRQNGIIEPLLVRPVGANAYQIVSGRNRCNAARSLGQLSVPVIIRTMTEDEAIIQMTTTNLIRRDDLLLSEKAFAYRMRLEAMNRQGQRMDIASDPAGPKLGSRSNSELSEQVGDSTTQIKRYIRLTYLIAPLLELVDKGQLSVRPAVVLSYLSPAEQETVCRFCFEDGRHPVTEAHAEQLRRWSEAGEQLTAERLAQLFAPQTAKPPKKVAVPVKSIRRYFRADATEREMQETILKALAQYFEGKEV